MHIPLSSLFSISPLSMLLFTHYIFIFPSSSLQPSPCLFTFPSPSCSHFSSSLICIFISLSSLFLSRLLSSSSISACPFPSSPHPPFHLPFSLLHSPSLLLCLPLPFHLPVLPRPLASSPFLPPPSHPAPSLLRTACSPPCRS